MGQIKKLLESLGQGKIDPLVEDMLAAHEDRMKVEKWKVDSIIAMTSKFCAIARGMCDEQCVHFRKPQVKFKGVFAFADVLDFEEARCKLWCNND